MIEYCETKLLNKNIPSEISKFFTDELTNYLVIKDGFIIVSNLTEDYKKLTIKNISENLSVFEENSFLLKYNDESFQKNINSGLLIDVPKNFISSSNLHIFYVQENSDLNNNTVIIINENSEFSYFEYLYNSGESKINFSSNSIVKENAKLTYVGISNFDKDTKLNLIRNSFISRYGRSLYSLAEVNDGITDSKTFMLLEDEYAYGSVKTVAISSDNQKIKIKQLIEHGAPNTEGYIENYGVANNSSALLFEGIGKIGKGMKRSIARQQNRGIVLGENARLDANPLLLIDEYDVEASHGAAIGKIDEEQLYYLMSRGLTKKDAERLIISGFLSPITELLKSDELINDFIISVEKKTL